MDMDARSFTDVEEFIECARSMGWQGNCAQSRPGSFRVDLSVVRTPGMIGVQTRHSVASCREVATPVNATTFGAVVPQKDGNRWCHRSFDEVVVQMMPRGDYTAANPAGHLGFQLAFADDKVAEVCDQHEIATPLREDACLIELTDSRRGHMLKRLKALFSAGNQLASTQISDELLSLFVQSFASAPNTGGRCRGLARRRALTRARDYMLENIGEAITLAEVSRFANSSRRNLTNAFKESFGVGPMAYLKLLRLNRAYRMLCRSNFGIPLRISDVANDNGFWHMGQFASDYRQLFGELPSQTLQNRNKLVG